MSFSRAVACAAAASALLLCLFAVPSSAQTCTGPSISYGPPVVPSFNIYSGPSEFVASQRTLTSTTQIYALSMLLLYTVAQNQTTPIDLSFALYGPPTCGGVGESTLLAQTSILVIPANTFYAQTPVSYTIGLTSPIIVAPGKYYVSMDSSSVFLDPLFGSATGTNVLVDSYTVNTFNLSTPVSFPSTTLFDALFLNVDTNATIIGNTCTNNESPTTLPSCTPRPFATYPSGYSQASLPCSSSYAVSYNTYDFSTYNYQVGLATDVVRLIPTVVPKSMTLYAVSFLAHPQTSATTTFTMRPAVYVAGDNSTAFNLLAQAAQTTIPGSTLAGQFTYLYFPLLVPVNVTAGQTIWINRLVDQSGLVLVFDESGTSLTGPTTITSAQPAPPVVTTTTTGGLDVSRGLLGCGFTQNVFSSSGVSMSSSSGGGSYVYRSSSSAAKAPGNSAAASATSGLLTIAAAVLAVLMMTL